MKNLLRKFFPKRQKNDGVCNLILTNDPDHGKVEDYKKVFDALRPTGLKWTTAVFCTMEDDGSDLAKHCYKGETHTLADPEYRDLMLKLQDDGHEIAFHGYSQVSNTREKFIAGLEIFRKIFGHYPFTYIEHGGNPSKHPIGGCKKETLAVDGLKPDSPYYVWDIIQSKIECLWAWHHLLDDAFEPVDELFYKRDGVLCFARHRMYYLPEVFQRASRDCTIMGYTHFGYEWYANKKKYYLERWTNGREKKAVRELNKLIENYNVCNFTVKEFVKSF